MIYWETSRKPLFIKTVWSNGHHHALLHKEDKDIFPSKLPRRSAVEVARKAPSCRPRKPENSNLNISSVNILSPSGRKVPIPRTSRTFDPCYKEMKRTYTIDVIPAETMKFKDMNKDTIFKPKIAAFGVKYHKQKPEQIVAERINSLSERVMVWLDLAAQNGQLYYHQPPAPHQRVAAEERCETPIEDVQITSAVEGEEHEEEGDEVEEYEEKRQEEQEIHCEPKKHQRPNGFAHDKRQLHIFIPSIPAKRTDFDGDSTFSSVT